MSRLLDTAVFLSTEPKDSADVAGLVYIPDREAGITRRRRGRGFSYHDPDGDLVSDAERERIEALVIPPAWEDVWICPLPNGHLQATGRDEKGRKQYRYHERWGEVRGRVKFNRMIPFGESLTPARQGGLASMLQRMQQAAQRYVRTA